MIFNPAVRSDPSFNKNGREPLRAKDEASNFELSDCCVAFNLIQTFEKGAFHALDKRYLERLLLNIHAADPLQVRVLWSGFGSVCFMRFIGSESCSVGILFFQVQLH